MAEAWPEPFITPDNLLNIDRTLQEMHNKLMRYENHDGSLVCNCELALLYQNFTRHYSPHIGRLRQKQHRSEVMKRAWQKRRDKAAQERRSRP